MRRKRLQHAADTLCHMFCGWRLINSYRAIERLGSGTLLIDALTGASTHNGAPVPSLSIAEELRLWLAADLADHQIPPQALREAMLQVELTLSHVPRAGRTTSAQHFHPSGERASPAAFLRCTLHCASRVATDERVYTSTYDDVEEWPPGWPEETPPIARGAV